VGPTKGQDMPMMWFLCSQRQLSVDDRVLDDIGTEVHFNVYRIRSDVSKSVAGTQFSGIFIEALMTGYLSIYGSTALCWTLSAFSVSPSFTRSV
jgi:hypothetical protein